MMRKRARRETLSPDLKPAAAALALIAGYLFPAAAAAEGDAERGREAYRQCIACHSLDPGKHRTGPTLHGIYGAPIGMHDDYRYSSGFKRKAEAGGVWDNAALDAFLEEPRKFIRGTKMAFKGIEDPAERQDIIAYLKTAQ